MKKKSTRLSALIISVGLLIAVGACLVFGILRAPVVTEHSFDFSVTYKINGEVKVLKGVYHCSFDGIQKDSEPGDRYYTGVYVGNESSKHNDSYKISERNGLELYIVVPFNDPYLMGDTGNDYYDEIGIPYLLAFDEDGCGYEDSETLGVFNAEIVSQDYPEPIENSLEYAGISRLHPGSMFLMLLVALLTLCACLIFVKREPDTVYGILDKIGVGLNYATAFAALPIITLAAWLIQAFPTGPDWIYQLLLCVPPIIAFTLTASVTLRRTGYRIAGFAIQFVGPVIFLLLALLEFIL